MDRRKRLHSIILVLAMLLSPSASFGKSDQMVDTAALPMAVIQYAFALGYGEFFSGSASRGSEGAQLYAINKLLNDRFRAAGFDLPTRFGFVGQSFIVQPSMEGNKYIGDNTESILYVTTPIKSLGGKAVVILSSSGPQRTTIFDLDSGFDIKPIYDSISLNRYAGGVKCFPMGHVNSVVVSRSNTLVLHETSTHFYGGKRLFHLKISSGGPTVECPKAE